MFTFSTLMQRALGFKVNEEKEADDIWRAGSMNIYFAQPGLWNKWPASYIAYWRQWVGEERLTPYTSEYATIEDHAFWKTWSNTLPKAHFASNHLRALLDAGWRGNLSVFEALEEHHIAAYADVFRVPGRAIRRNGGIVHPDTIAWMRQHGYWHQDTIDGLGRRYLFQRDDIGSIDGPIPTLFHGDPPEASLAQYGFDWAMKALRDNGWSADVQARFLGDTMMNAPLRCTSNLMKALKPWMDTQVDVVMLAAVCGQDIELFGDLGTHPEVVQLYRSVAVVGRTAEKAKAFSVLHAHRFKPYLVFNSGSDDVNLLMESTPPSTAMELYRWALGAKKRLLASEQLHASSASALV